MDNNLKVDLARLPLCQDSLVPHTNRVNHRVACFKKANVPIFERPKPYDEHQGWSLDENGVLKPLWTRGFVLPQNLIDLLDSGIDGDEDEEEEEDMEMGECDIDDEMMIETLSSFICESMMCSQLIVELSLSVFTNSL